MKIRFWLLVNLSSTDLRKKEMSNLEYVISNDRYATAKEFALMLVDGNASLDEATGYIDEIVEIKKFFADFYGEFSHEFYLVRSMLNILRMIRRSMRVQKEDGQQSVAEWVDKYPTRIHYFRKLQAAMDVPAL